MITRARLDGDWQAWIPAGGDVIVVDDRIPLGSDLEQQVIAEACAGILGAWHLAPHAEYDAHIPTPRPGWHTRARVLPGGAAS